MIVLIVPPAAKPCEPLNGAYSLARFLRRRVECMVIDSSLDWCRHRLWGRNLGELAATIPAHLAVAERTHLRRALKSLERGNPLTDPKTYRNSGRYRQAVSYLETVLQWPRSVATDEQPGLADFRVKGMRAVCREHLLQYMERGTTVLDDYLEQMLLPQLADLKPTAIGFSLTFLHQVFPTLRMARLIRRHLPRIPLLLGGALVDCWHQADWRRPPFDMFQAVIAMHPSRWQTWDKILGAPLPMPHGQPFFPDPDDIREKSFFAPQSIFPLAMGMGCSWGRCSFCPDYQKHRYQPSRDHSWRAGVEAALASHPSLAIHLTDSCVVPASLDHLAMTVLERNWPVRWYAFARLGKSLLKPGRLELWARGGCGMLQFGLETASQDLLAMMNKGFSLEYVPDILRESSAAGIRNYIYLLFGFPEETSDHQLQTMEFIINHQEHIHYLNNAVFNLPKDSPIAVSPQLFGIRKLLPLSTDDQDLSLYLDFADGQGSARRRARSFLQQTFLQDPIVRGKVQALPPVFKSNHALFASWP